MKQQSYQNNSNKSYTERKAIHEPCGYSLNLVCSFDYSFYRGNDECLGESTEKYIGFSVPIKKEHDNDSGETITYKIKFIDSCRFMPSKLSNLVDNLSEINNKDCKTCIERKKY